MLNKLNDPKTHKRKKYLIAFYESKLTKHNEWLEKYRLKKGVEEYLKKYKSALKVQELINKRLAKIELTKKEIERISKIKVRPKFNKATYWKNYVARNKDKYSQKLRYKWSKASLERKKARILKEEGEYGLKKFIYEKLGTTNKKYETYEEMLAAKKPLKEITYQSNEKYRRSWGSGVYMVECKEGIYIGFSTRLRGRKCTHFQTTPTTGSSIAGIFTPLAFIILEKTEDPTRERYWIDKLKPTLNNYKVGK